MSEEKRDENKPKWTAQQKQAITAQNTSLIVSAAAGSGKTAVLTERILSEITKRDGLSLSRMVVVTFTKAAAAELKKRLYDKLSEKAAAEPENARVAEQLLELGSAAISTVHSFCLQLIREYRRELGLPAKIRVADDAETDSMRKTAVEEALSRLAETALERGEASSEWEFLQLFCDTDSDSALAALMLGLANAVNSYPGGVDYLREENEKNLREAQKIQNGTLRFSDTRFGKEIFHAAALLIDAEIAKIDAILRLLPSTQELDGIYSPAFEEKRAILDQMSAYLKEEKIPELLALTEPLFQSLPTVRKLLPEERDIKDFCHHTYFNDTLKKKFKKELEALFSDSTEEILADYQKFYALCTVLCDLMEDFNARYSAAKREKGILDYADQEQFALRLVSEKRDGVWIPTEIGKKLQEKFDAIFVDEYQDTNFVQDRIFRSVSREDNLFLVGDPKQSIYSFRGAVPSIFTDYKNNAPLYTEGTEEKENVIFLSDNFRCDKTVVDFVNRVFAVLMDEEAPNSLYGKADRLVFSKKTEENFVPKDTELILIDPYQNKENSEETVAEEPEDEENPQKDKNALGEAEAIASRIAKMLRGGETKSDGTPLLASDIAVLARQAKFLRLVQNALYQKGVPCLAPKDEDLCYSPTFLFMTSVLSALENPMKDVGLVGAMTSAVFRFTTDELYLIRQGERSVPFYSSVKRYLRTAEESGEADEIALKLSAFVDFLHSVRKKLPFLSLSELCWLILKEKNVAELYSALDPLCDQAIEVILNLAQRFDSIHLSLFAFLGELTKRVPEEESSGEGVNLLTIHKSKGLEFPVVFVSFLGNAFNTEDEKKKQTLLVSPEFGATFYLPRAGGRIKYNSVFRKASILRRHREMLEEETRILYVALTRAREKLILTGTASVGGFGSLTAFLKRSFASFPLPLGRDLSGALLREAKERLSPILVSLHDSPALRGALENGDGFENGFSVHIIPRPKPSCALSFEREKRETVAEVLPDREEMQKILDFRYENEGIELLPKKLSVSEILRSGREEENGYSLIPLLNFGEVQKNDAAFRGTAMHEAMQYMDFSAAEKDFSGELTRLKKRAFLSEEQFAVLDQERLRAFFDSELYREMKHSPRLIREKRFNVLLDGEDIIGKKGDILIQGVIDACFENPDGTLTLFDFKTDRVREADGERVLRERHAPQLRLYLRAMEEITKKKVSRLFLYSFSLSRAVQIPLTEEE